MKWYIFKYLVPFTIARPLPQLT